MTSELNGEREKTLTDLLVDVEPKYVTPHLVKKNAISLEDQIYILFGTGTVRRKSNEAREKLLEVLLIRGLESLRIFFEHIYEDYPWLTKQIKCDYLKKELKYKLEVGYVPLMQFCEVDRPEVVREIQDALISASLNETKPQWVVLHGMVGSGKSVTVSQAIRKFQYLELYFPDGIFFLGIGLVKEDNALLLKLQCLCKHFEDKYHPDTKEAAIQFLKKKTRKYPKFLLILDDVWEDSIIQDFTIGWTILITTRDKSKFRTNRKMVTVIDMPKGFTLEESKNYIAKRVYTNPSKLNSCALKLHEQYQGLPIMINIIGTAMEDHGNDDDDRWKWLYNGLTKERISRTRQYSGQNDLSKALRMMVEDLNEDLREKFKDFFLFWDDYYIPCQVFEVLWGMPHLEVEDIMDELAKKSLVQKTKDEDSDHKRYGIHDLYLKFLKEEYQSIITERHKILVKKYLDKCKNENNCLDLSRLPQDGYIHIFLAYHLEQAKMFEYFPAIFFDLKFFISKVKMTGPHDLHYDLDSYSKYYEGQEDTLNDFLRFISLNGHLLCDEEVDVIQLALNEPKTSCIHRKAQQLIIERSLNIITSSPDKLYFEYCNRSNNFNSMLLSKKPHANSVSWVIFSPCNRIIASCGSDNLVKVWDCNSGKNLQQFVGHTKPVTCCAFSRDGRYLASSSEDQTVKIWNLDSLYEKMEKCASPLTPRRPRSGSFIFGDSADTDENLLRTFTEHRGSVTTCTFSQDDKMIASGSEDGTVIVWNPYEGTVIYQLRCHEEPVLINHCCFSPDSNYVASCGSDSFVLIWDIDSGKEYKRFFHNDKSVESCRFSSDGQTLISAAGQYVWKWDIEKEKAVYQYNNLKTVYYVKCCAFSLDEELIIGGTSERALVLWKENNGSIDASYKFQAGAVQCVNIAHDGSKLASASEDSTVMIFDMNVLRQQNSISLVSLIPEFSVQFKNDEPVVATIDECNKIRVFEGIEAKKKFYSPEAESDEITSCCLSPDCGKLLYGTKSGFVQVLCLKTKAKQPYNFHVEEITCCLYLDEEKRFVTASADGIVVLWENSLDGSTKCKPMMGHKEKIMKCLHYEMKEGSRLLTCGRDGLLIAWNLQNLDIVHTMKHDDTITSCDVSLDRKLFASACVDKCARIWDATDGKLLHTFKFSHCVRSCKFSHRGDYLAAGDDDGILRIFNVLKPLSKYQELKGHENFVYDVAWSPDDSRLVSVANEICWWDVKANKMLQKFFVKGKDMKRIYTSRDFKVFVTIDANGILYILKQFEG